MFKNYLIYCQNMSVIAPPHKDGWFPYPMYLILQLWNAYFLFPLLKILVIRRLIIALPVHPPHCTGHWLNDGSKHKRSLHPLFFPCHLKIASMITFNTAAYYCREDHDVDGEYDTLFNSKWIDINDAVFYLFFPESRVRCKLHELICWVGGDMQEDLPCCKYKTE